MLVLVSIGSMSESAALPRPRKLYTHLRECASTQARAQAALEFVRTSTSTDGGFLFLARAGDLVLVASTQGLQAPVDLIEEARRTWDRELDRQPEDNKTLEFSSLDALLAAQERPLW